ncbi:MAG: hypothetical protein JWM80_6012 [Cyanobacteria bacterium RYN_339]|nr:hypothetical protein [Cyanobacteria bacterium RYN_339]
MRPMNQETLGILRCPGCHGAYRLEAGSVLQCGGCGVQVPMVEGFAHFGEAQLAGEPVPRDLQVNHAGAYRRFLDQKRQRAVFDCYAAFQPFNESTRALLPLVPLLRETLRPGDRILDLWGRTGYSGELLAGLFPEQRVVSLWEGDAGVLGYLGYRHWLGEGARAANLDVLFASPEKPLPLATGAFAIVHGLDTLHRYGLLPLLAECFRVCAADGIVVFPHVHLANSEPEPYFDRGGRIAHGRVYREHFARTLAEEPRRAYILSEARLFEEGDGLELRDDADMAHYNGLALVGSRSWEGRHLALPGLPDRGYLLPNPLVAVDPLDGRPRPAPNALGGTAADLFMRHPIYHRRLARRLPERLTLLQRQLLYWAERAVPLEALPTRVGRAESDVRAAVASLVELELAQAVPVSAAMARLYAFYAGRDAEAPSTFPALWERAGARYGAQPLVVAPDGRGDFSFTDAEDVTSGLAAFMTAHKIRRVALVARPHVEYLLAVWACLRAGVVVAPLDAEAPRAEVLGLLERLEPDLVFVDEARLSLARGQAARWVVFDEDDVASAPAQAFAEVLQPWLGQAAPACDVAADDVAVVLFTSGSTGRAKGVELTQGALCRSAALMARVGGWREGDRLLSQAAFHSMSGFRNPAVAALASGATVVVPVLEDLHPVAVMARCAAERVTVLGTVPAFLAGLGDRPLARHNLRLALVTGARLAPEVAARAEATLGVPVVDYFGLTETAGICASAAPEAVREPGAVGRPVGAIAAIVDPTGEPVAPGEVGELWIYGDNLMRGYFRDPELTAAAFQDGWLRTGDLARSDGAGGIVLVGRRDDRIKTVRGELVYASEVADALAAHPGVAEVAVVPYTGAEGYQHLAAFVVPAAAELPETTLRDHVAARCGIHKVPALIRQVTTLPRGGSGKVRTADLLESLYGDRTV